MPNATPRTGRPRRMANARLVQAWVPLEIAEALSVLERRTQRSKASHIREALGAYIDRIFLPAPVDENTRKVG